MHATVKPTFQEECEKKQEEPFLGRAYMKRSLSTGNSQILAASLSLLKRVEV
jgi:hypothetical protein